MLSAQSMQQIAKRIVSFAVVFLIVIALIEQIKPHLNRHHNHKHTTSSDPSRPGKSEQLKQTIKANIATISEQVYPQGKTMLAKSLLATTIISVIPFFLLWLMPPLDRNHYIMRLMLAFSSGALLGDAFLHLIPHVLADLENIPASEAAEHCGQLVLTGIMCFFLLDKVIRIIMPKGCQHHFSNTNTIRVDEGQSGSSDTTTDGTDQQKQKGQDGMSTKRRMTDNTEENSTKKPLQTDSPKIHKCHTVIQSSKSEDRFMSISSGGYLSLIADFAHNFTDGIAIGASFAAGDKIGYVSTLSILMHEIPHELGDYALLVRNGFSHQKAIQLQLVTALGSVIGCLLAAIAAQIATANIVIMAITAGGFIYVSTVTILPDLIESANTKYESGLSIAASMAAGVTCMVVVGYLE